MEDRETVLADISLEIDVDIEARGTWDMTHHAYHIRVVFELQERIAYRQGSFKVSTEPFDMEGYIPLTEHLIPVLSKVGIEKFAEDILRKNLPIAIENQKKNDPSKLAANLGMSVIYLPLYRCPKTKSILFFKASTIKVEIEDEVTKES